MRYLFVYSIANSLQYTIAETRIQVQLVPLNGLNKLLCLVKADNCRGEDVSTLSFAALFCHLG